MPYSGPLNNPPAKGESPIWSYGYIPSLPMGIVGCVSFLVISLPHLWWFIKKRGTRSVHGLFFFACLLEALGYGSRLYTHDHQFSDLAFLFGIFLVQAATVPVYAALYKSIQRGLKYMPNGENLSPMRLRSMLTVFIALDVFWVVVQVLGQYFWAAAQSAELLKVAPMFYIGTSTVIFLVGVVLQAITTIIMAVFCFVILKRSAKVLAVTSPETTVPHIRPLIAQILISLGLCFVRLIMRIAQGGQGAYGSAATKEVYFGVFEYSYYFGSCQGGICMKEVEVKILAFCPKCATFRVIPTYEYAPIFLIIVLWAVRPLYRFIFPFGHPRYNNGSHAQEAAITSSVNGSNATETATKA